jgi:CPA2 family monovalent cation:H+ antiporter-2
VHRLLAERGAIITVIELNLDTVRRLRANGCNALYADVLRSGTLDEAGIAESGSLIISADVENAAEIVRQAHLLNKDLRIFVRCAHLREVAAIRRAGATVVAAGEVEVAVALAEAVTEGDNNINIIDQRENIRNRLYSSSK